MSTGTVRQTRQNVTAAEAVAVEQSPADKLRVLCERRLALERRLNEAKAAYIEEEEISTAMAALIPKAQTMKRGDKIEMTLPNGVVMVFSKPSGGWKVFKDFETKIKEAKK